MTWTAITLIALTILSLSSLFALSLCRAASMGDDVEWDDATPEVDRAYQPIMIAPAKLNRDG